MNPRRQHKLRPSTTNRAATNRTGSAGSGRQLTRYDSVVRKRSEGFTLIEVMIAVAILGLGLTAIFSSEWTAIHMGHSAQKMNIAALLARCKMGEIEEQVMREGFPAVDDSGSDACCEGGEIEGFTCEWSIDRVVLPDAYLEGAENEGDGALGELSSVASDEGTQTGALDSMLGGGGAIAGGGMAEMAIGIAFPVMKPAIEEQVRRATVTVQWEAGLDNNTRNVSFDVVQYLVAEQADVAPDQPTP